MLGHERSNVAQRWPFRRILPEHCFIMSSSSLISVTCNVTPLYPEQLILSALARICTYTWYSSYTSVRVHTWYIASECAYVARCTSCAQCPEARSLALPTRYPNPIAYLVRRLIVTEHNLLFSVTPGVHYVRQCTRTSTGIIRAGHLLLYDLVTATARKKWQL